MIDLKRCPGCEVEKPRTTEHFYRNKSRPDELHALCKVCEKLATQTDEYKAKRKKLRQSEGYRAYMKAYTREYQKTDKYKKYQAAYETTDKRKAYKKAYSASPSRRAYQEERRELTEVKLYMRDYQKTYKQTGKYKQYQRSYNQSDAAKEAHKRYHQTERGKASQTTTKQRRRARVVLATGDYTQEEWIALCAAYDYKCLACQEKKPLTVDHITPLSKGGSNDISNIQPLCQSCNSAKGTKTVDYRTNQPRFQQLSLF